MENIPLGNGIKGERRMELITEILEEIVGFLMTDRSVPRVIRYIVTTIIYGACIALFIFCVTASQSFWGKAFCTALTVLFAGLYIRALCKISRN